MSIEQAPSVPAPADDFARSVGLAVVVEQGPETEPERGKAVLWLVEWARLAGTGFAASDDVIVGHEVLQYARFKASQSAAWQIAIRDRTYLDAIAASTKTLQNE
jgi:hypothetical protein